MAQVQQAVHVGVREVAKELLIGRALSCRERGCKRLPPSDLRHLLLVSTFAPMSSLTRRRRIDLEHLGALPLALRLLLDREQLIAPCEVSLRGKMAVREAGLRRFISDACHTPLFTSLASAIFSVFLIKEVAIWRAAARQQCCDSVPRLYLITPSATPSISSQGESGAHLSIHPSIHLPFHTKGWVGLGEPNRAGTDAGGC